jgi:RNase P subunit RPR2
MAMNCVRIMCPNLTCRKVLSVPESLRGKTVRCKNCMTNIRVPVKQGLGNSGKQQGAA